MSNIRGIADIYVALGICFQIFKFLTQYYRDHKILELLYEEAKYNILTGRYPCEISDYIMLGGIQARLELGPYDMTIHTPSYFRTIMYRSVNLVIGWLVDLDIFSEFFIKDCYSINFLQVSTGTCFMEQLMELLFTLDMGKKWG